MTSIEDLKKKTVEELKAIAFDQAELLNMAQQNLQILRSLINEKQSAKPEVKPEVPNV